MTGISKAATGVLKNLTYESGSQKTGSITRFFKKMLSGKTKVQTPRFEAPKDQFVKAQADNIAAIKADKAYFEKFTRQNQKQLVQDIKTFRQTQRQSIATIGAARQTAKPTASPVRQNVAGQSLGAAGEPVYKNGVNVKTGLSKSVEDRVARLKGLDPNKSQEQVFAELQTRLAALKRPNGRLPLSPAKEAADLERLRKLPSNVQITPAQFQFETKRLKNLERIQQTRREIMADTKLTAAQRRKQLDGLNTILKDYT